MINYDTLPNTAGAFPDVEGKDATGAGATDGTAFIKQFVDDYFGARQAVMQEAGLAPNGIQESATASQFLAAMKKIIGDNVWRSDIMLKNWNNDNAIFTAVRRNVNFALGHWLSVGAVSPELQYAAVGDRWRLISVPSAEALNDVAGNDLDTIAVAVGENGTIAHGTTVTSAWTNNDHGSVDFTCVFFANGIWCAATVDGDIYTATDPTGLWTLRVTPASATNDPIHDIMYIPSLNLWVAVGLKGAGVVTGIYTAPDPTSTWTQQTNPIAGSCEFFDVGFDGTNIIASGGSGVSFGNFVRSTNGTSFTDKSSSLPWGAGDEVTAMACDNNGHVVIYQHISTASANLLFSDDSGDTWTGVYFRNFAASSAQGMHYSEQWRGFMYVDGASELWSLRT